MKPRTSSRVSRALSVLRRWLRHAWISRLPLGQWRQALGGPAPSDPSSNQAAMQAGAEVLWPEQESLYALMSLRATIGPAAYASEKQGDPVNPEQCEWDATYFDYSDFWFDTWPSGIILRTLGLDPSKGKDSKHGDYSAFVKLGIDRDQVMYVEADLHRRPTPQIVEAGVDLVNHFRPTGSLF